MYYKYKNIESLVGEIIKSVDKSHDEIIFETESGVKYKMFHIQDCCENVSIEDIDGDLQDLVGQKIILAEERTKVDDTDSYGSSMWTFYTIRTVKDSLTIRWYGSSNGYYSISVDFVEL